MLIKTAELIVKSRGTDNYTREYNKMNKEEQVTHDVIYKEACDTTGSTYQHIN